MIGMEMWINNMYSTTTFLVFAFVAFFLFYSFSSTFEFFPHSLLFKLTIPEFPFWWNDNGRNGAGVLIAGVIN